MIASTTMNPLAQIKSLEGYMAEFGTELHQNALNCLDPLHVPGRDEPIEFDLGREPFAPQAHVITSTVKALKRLKHVNISGEMGTGKTMMGMAAIHSYSRSIGRPAYRCILYCPGQLVLKWERELRQTIPNCEVHQIRSWTDLKNLHVPGQPDGPTFYIIPRDKGKLGAKWQGACLTKKGSEAIRCPNCHGIITNDDNEMLTSSDLDRKRLYCKHTFQQDDEDAGKGCGAPLWTYYHAYKKPKWVPADYIKQHMRHYFDYAIFDEIHELKGGGNVAQANAAHKIHVAVKKSIGLTGTLLGGKAEDIRSLLGRYSSTSMGCDGFNWHDMMAFNETYGRIEERVSTKSRVENDEDNRQSCGRATKSKSKQVKPGIMPTLFGRHIMESTIFLSLDEMSDELPPLIEDTIAVDMDPDLAAAYHKIASDLESENRMMVQRGDRRLMSTMLQTMLSYPDHPYGFGNVGYVDDGHFMPVTHCPDFPESRVFAKEQALIDLVHAERQAGRQVWIYVQYTNKRDVAARLERLLANEGMRVKVLRSDTVAIEKREKWIFDNGHDADVIISHPKIVETGLDLFDKGGNHNFATLIFYETGYNAFTLRQAARRAWRIGQMEDCKVFYMFYKATSQQSAMELMGKKIEAATAIEGKFSSSGLMAMLGEDDDADDMALARAMADRVDESTIQRNWSRVTMSNKPRISVPKKRVEFIEPVKPKPAKRSTPKKIEAPKPEAKVDWDSLFDDADWLMN